MDDRYSGKTLLYEGKPRLGEMGIRLGKVDLEMVPELGSLAGCVGDYRSRAAELPALRSIGKSEALGSYHGGAVR